MQENQTPMKIERVSIVDQVGEAIKQKILNGSWQVGDKLPPEAEIAQMYGVNRLSVRMVILSICKRSSNRSMDCSYTHFIRSKG